MDDDIIKQAALRRQRRTRREADTGNEAEMTSTEGHERGRQRRSREDPETALSTDWEMSPREGQPENIIHSVPQLRPRLGRGRGQTDNVLMAGPSLTSAEGKVNTVSRASFIIHIHCLKYL